MTEELLTCGEHAGSAAATHPPEAWRPRAHRRPARELWRLTDPVREPQGSAAGASHPDDASRNPARG